MLNLMFTFCIFESSHLQSNKLHSWLFSENFLFKQKHVDVEIPEWHLVGSYCWMGVSKSWGVKDNKHSEHFRTIRISDARDDWINSSSIKTSSTSTRLSIENLMKEVKLVVGEKEDSENQVMSLLCQFLASSEYQWEQMNNLQCLKVKSLEDKPWWKTWSPWVSKRVSLKIAIRQY